MLIDIDRIKTVFDLRMEWVISGHLSQDSWLLTAVVVRKSGAESPLRIQIYSQNMANDLFDMLNAKSETRD